MGVESINISSLLDDKSKLESPEVRRLFQERNSNIGI
jgi:hypothetical protein